MKYEFAYLHESFMYNHVIVTHPLPNVFTKKLGVKDKIDVMNLNMNKCHIYSDLGYLYKCLIYAPNFHKSIRSPQLHLHEYDKIIHFSCVARYWSA